MLENIQFDQLNQKELKILRKACLRQFFPSLFAALFLFLILLIYSSLNNDFGWLFYSLLIASALAGITVFLFLTRKYRADSKSGNVKLIEEMVEDKVSRLDYEPGSATVPVNLLSALFYKKIFLREMKEVHIYYAIVGSERIDLCRADWDFLEKGQPIILRRAPKSNLFLGFNGLPNRI